MARKRSFFVPRAVLGASFAGVVPACVALGLQACSSGPVIGVAAVAYCCFEAGPDGSEGGDAAEASADAAEDATATDATDDVPNDGADE